MGGQAIRKGHSDFVDSSETQGSRDGQPPIPYKPPPDPYAGQRFGGMSMGPIQQPQGFDMSSPGAAEQYFGMNQMRYMAPGQGMQWWQNQGGQYGNQGAGEQHWDQVKGKFGGPTQSESYFKDYEQNLPEFGAYYDRAKERTMGDMNSQLAGRGAYGSSVGLDQLGQSVTDLEAHRANREADYMMNQARLGGQLAGQADSQRLAQLGLGGQMANQAQQLMLSRLGQAGQMAMGVDATDLSRLNAGMNAAMGAQGQRRTRGRDYMSDMFNPSQMLMGQVGGQLENLLRGDQDLLQQMIEAALGLGKERQGQDYRGQKQHREDFDQVMGVVGSFMGGGGGGGMGKMMGGGK